MDLDASYTISLSEDVSIHGEEEEQEEEEDDAPLTDSPVRGASSFAEWKRQERESSQDKDIPMAAYNSPIFSTPGEKAASHIATGKYQSSSFDFGGFIKETKESTERDGAFVVLRNVNFSVPIKQRIDDNPLHRPVLAQRSLLNDISLFLAPSTMTLLLGPPGCGKSTLLKFLAQRLPTGVTKGDYLISNNPPDLTTHHRDTGYITQEDSHLAPLTVAETLMFSANCQMPQSCSEEMKRERVEKTMELLGISHRADVIVGNAMMRGVSGGEKRRVSIGVEVVKAPSFILMDEPTTGLDSQVAYKVMKRMKKLSTLGQVPILAALLQPSFELFSLFDNVIILGEGEVVYFGPTIAALPYFEEIGFHCPIEENPADFLQNVLQTPQLYARERTPEDSFPVINSTQDFVREYKASVHYEAVLEVLGRAEAPVERPQHHYKQHANYPTSYWYQLKLCLDRETNLVKRDTKITKARIMKSLIFSLILGTLFFQLDTDQKGARYRIALLFFALTSANMSGLVSIPGLIARRDTFIQQRDGMYYHTIPYLVSMTVTELPVVLAEVLISTTIVWWMANISSNGASYLYFIIVTFMLELFSMSMCRLVASVSPTFEMANSTAPSLLALSILFCGFMITRTHIPWYWRWIYYAAPMAYALHGAMIAGVHGATFHCKDDQYVPSSDLPNFNEPYPEGFEGNQICPITTGDEYLKSVDMYTDSGLKWIFLIPIVVMIIVTTLATFWAMKSFSFETAKGGKEVQTPHDDSDSETIHISTEKKPDSSISFFPVSLYFEDIRYSVPIIEKGKKKNELQLLNGISGFAEPGSLVALMGSSGAGKSTLLDVLADRKTYGRITGTITINGRPRDRLFTQITGYVEQQDLHIETQTVREAIEFSALLRLPNSQYSKDQKLNFADSILEILELTSIEDRLLRTISMEQKKRVTIGVEMAANPSLLFLDEPTSGLDSNGAERVMVAVARIANSGRTVVCTIHQPSRKLFSLFSHLLLLKKGGEVAYFGKVGVDGEDLKNYFGQFGFNCPPQKNPADFILDISGNSSVQTAQFYKESELCRINEAHLKGRIHNTENQLPPEQGRYAVTFGEQLHQNLIREVKRSIRTKDLVFSQLIASMVVALMIGTLYIQLPHNQSGYGNRVSLLFFSVVFIALNSMSAIPGLMSSRPAFYREHASATYRSPAFLLAHDLVDFPITVVVLFIFCISSYWISGLNADPSRFGIYLLFCLLFFLCQKYLCQAVASLTPAPEVANIFSSGFTTLTSLFSGFLLPSGSIPPWWIWLYYFSPTSYLLEGIVSNEMYGEEYQCDDNEFVQVPISGTNETKMACPVTSGTDALKLYDFDYDHIQRNLLVLLGFVCFFQIMTHIGFRFARVIKR